MPAQGSRSKDTRPSVLVTGSSTGIGRACALELDRRGWRVFAGVRREADGEPLRRESSDGLQPVLLDVTDREQITRCADQVRTANPRGIDALVNNAGIAVAGPLEAIPIEEFKRQIDVNLSGQVAVTQAFLPQLRQTRGRLVFISSDNGRLSVPCLAPYSASKHAIEAIADALRLELREAGVRVVLIEPGAIRTPIWEKTRNGALEVRRAYPPELERVYGAIADSVEGTAMKHAARAIAPERVAKVVATAVTTRRPRTRYAVGLDARIGLLLARWAPTRLRDWAVARSAGIG